jgi:hypothetical protein
MAWFLPKLAWFLFIEQPKLMKSLLVEQPKLARFLLIEQFKLARLLREQSALARKTCHAGKLDLLDVGQGLLSCVSV